MNKVNSEAIMQLLMLWLYSQLFAKLFTHWLLSTPKY